MRSAVAALVLLTACEVAETGGGDSGAASSSDSSSASSSGTGALAPCGEIVCEHHPGHLCNYSIEPGSPFISGAARDCDGAYTCVCPEGQTCSGTVCGIEDDATASSSSAGGAGGAGGRDGSGGSGGQGG